MQRYFMTVREAVAWCCRPASSGVDAMPGRRRHRAASSCSTWAQPVRIVDLARQMIRLAGLRPDQDVQITYTGLRPGEKLFEELFHGRSRRCRPAIPAC